MKNNSNINDNKQEQWSKNIVQKEEGMNSRNKKHEILSDLKT